MSTVFEIGITEKNNKEIERKKTIEVIASKGIIGDRYSQGEWYEVLHVYRRRAPGDVFILFQ